MAVGFLMSIFGLYPDDILFAARDFGGDVGQTAAHVKFREFGAANEGERQSYDEKQAAEEQREVHGESLARCAR